ncbi:MAG: serine/threonine protein kinase, partial [Myxococcales bacterium]|nr:serine/threonine protein kinase [Myxococcales bacterium]
MVSRGDEDAVDDSVLEDSHLMRWWGSEHTGTPDPLREAHRSMVLGAMFGAPTLRRFGRYVVLDVLGQGGMGTVLKGYDDELDRQVAIKVLHGGSTGQQGPRLRREAQALAKLAHPNVVQVYEVGEAEGQLFVAMELVKGQTLRQWQSSGGSPREWKECVEVYLQAGRGLAAAHAKGLVHRDFKPGNAILDKEGRTRVLDFGLARRGDEDDLDLDTGGVPSQIQRARTEPELAAPLDQSLTKTGAVLGTLPYMPPEQMDGREVDARSDQFSFCVALYEAVYGERPFAGESLFSLITAMRQGEVRPPPRGSSVPAALRRVLLRGLAVEPGERWPAMNDLLTELEELVEPRARRWVTPL